MTSFGSFLFNLGLSALPKPPQRNVDRVEQPSPERFRCQDCGLPFDGYMAYNDHICDRMFADWRLQDDGFDRAA